MKAVIFLFALTLLSSGVLADFTCPDATKEACLDEDDTVCPAYAKCVAADVVCLDENSCDSDRGFICGAEYDAVLKDYEKVVNQYNQLSSENVELRNERLEKRNCVINSATLKDAISCVRSQG
jgi:hypothetical protein